MTGKTVVVTGANGGIGRETCQGLATLGASVIMACRSGTLGTEAAAAIREDVPDADLDVRVLDLTDGKSISEFAARLNRRRGGVDVLVNNAGIHANKRRETDEGIEATFAVNHLGPFRLTNALLPALHSAPAARVVTVASIMHHFAIPRFGDLQMQRMYSATLQYSNTKLYNIWFSDVLADRLASDSITSNALHPGTGGTGLTREFSGAFNKAWGAAFKPVHRLAQTSIRLASDPALEGVTGGYFHAGRKAVRGALARSKKRAQQLWDATEELA